MSASIEQFTLMSQAEVFFRNGWADLIPAGVYLVDGAGIILHHNAMAVQLWGRRPRPGERDERFCGSYRLYRPDGTLLPHAATPVAEALRDGEPQLGIDVTIERPDGMRCHAKVHVNPLRDESGRIVGAINCFLDITEHKDFQERSHRTERMLREVTEAIPHLVWTGRPDGYVDYCNARWLEYTGLREDQIKGDGWAVALHPDDRESTLAAWLRATQTQRPYQVEQRLRSASGEYRWFLARANPVYDSAGQVQKWYGTCTDIEDHKRLEGDLRRSERLYRGIGESIDYGIWVCDPQGRNIYTSPSLLNLLGITQEQCSEFGWGNALHPDEADATLAAWKQCARSGTFWEREHRFRGKDGRWHVVLARGVPIRDERGLIQCWAGINLDIGRLKAAEDQFRTLADNVAQLVWMADASGWIFWYNQRWFDFTGTTLEQMEGWGWTQVHHPDHLNRVVEKFSRCIKNGEIWEDTFPLRGADGEYRWFLSRAVPIRDADGGVLRWFGTNTDVTEHRRAEEAIRAAREQLQLITDTMPAFVAQCGRDRRFRWVNKAYAERFGLQPSEVAGRPIQEIMGTEAYSRIKPRIERVLAGHAVDFETDLVYQTVGRRWVHVLYAPTYDAAREVDGWVAVISDITRRKELEQDLRTAMATAEQANRTKDEFIAALSHELRTPLTPVMMISQLLATDARLPEDVRQDLVTVRRNIELETRLIDDLLDLTRIARGKIQLRLEPVDVHASLRHALETCQDDDFSQKAFQVECDFDPGGAWVIADAARLEQVFWNVLKNAAKFTPTQGRISIRTRRLKDQVRIEISDTGVGIEAAKLGSIFNAFEQGGSETTRRFGGLGLGLAICKAITEVHGGRISAHSDGAQLGSTFTIELPAGQAASPCPTPAGSEPSGAAAPRDGPLRILLVEDHPPTAQVVSRLLVRWGYQVCTSATISAALEQAAAQRFDLVISDLGLPDGSGCDLMKHLRERYGLRGIALSGYGMEQDLQRSQASGFVRHLVKPVDFDQLKQIVDSIARPEKKPSTSV